MYGTIEISEGRILSITTESGENNSAPYIVPGFIDSHVHIESSMLIPSEFAKLAAVHGTTATISDPHEIANVCGIEGVNFMIRNGRSVPFKFHYGAPSCVPATIFETAGAAVNADEVDSLLRSDDIYYLSEMMNFPGVLYGDEEVFKKIGSAKKYNKPVDGHAPGLRGEDARKYIAAGISTDHECFSADEALDKLHAGMKILIREGSAAKNFDALIGLMDEHWKMMMFCSDDKHPDSLVSGHINQLCARAVKFGIDKFKVLSAACVNPVIHYNMRCGLLNENDAADMVVLKDLESFEVLETYIDGIMVASGGNSLVESTPTEGINRFDCNQREETEFRLFAADDTDVPMIEALDGQLITNRLSARLSSHNGVLEPDPENDILKIVVINRYQPMIAPAISFIKNFKLRNGALASSVAHDSHNIVAVGTDDASICRAVNLVIQAEGGISAVNQNEERSLPLPVAGLMSPEDGYTVAEKYTDIDLFVKKELGSALSAPFMTLSFMALLVIPHLKLSDKGLFDGDSFSFIN